MSVFSATPSVGDVVTPIQPIKTTMNDYLIGGDAGIKPPARGVVVDTSGWNSLDVEWDTGLWGTATARVKTHQVRVVARGVGRDRFKEHATRLRWMRAGVALAMIILVALLDGAVQGVLDLLSDAIQAPLQVLLYVVVLSALSRFAFGR